MPKVYFFQNLFVTYKMLLKCCLPTSYDISFYLDKTNYFLQTHELNLGKWSTLLQSSFEDSDSDLNHIYTMLLVSA